MRKQNSITSWKQLYKKVKTVSARRYVCLFCAGMLVLNSVGIPVCVWALDQENASEMEQEPDQNQDQDQSAASAKLEVKVAAPDLPIIEGYQDTISYEITLINPENGVDLTNLAGFASKYCDVYTCVTDEETGTEEEVLVYCHPSDPEMPEILGEGRPEEGAQENPGESGDGKLEEGGLGDSEGSEPGEGESGDSAESKPEEGEPGESAGNNSEGGKPGEGGQGESAENGSEDGKTEENGPDESAGSNLEGGKVEEGESGESAGNDSEDGKAEDGGSDGSAGSDSEDGRTEENDQENSGDSEDSADNTQEDGDSSAGSALTELARGESRTYIMRIPTGLPAGQYTETITFTADEIIDPIERTITFIVQSANTEGGDTDLPSEGTEEEKPSDGATEENPSEGTEEEKPSDGATEENPSEGTEEEKPSDGATEGNPPEGAEEEAPSDGTGGGNSSEGTEEETPSDGTEEEGSAESLPEDPAEGESEEDPAEEPDSSEEEENEEEEESEEVPAAGLAVVSREGGYYKENTFFATSAAVYELKVDMSTASTVYCDLNGVSRELSVLDGHISFALPEVYNGIVRFYVLGQDGSVVEELTEYVIAEKTAPSLGYSNVISQTDGTCAVHVQLEDCGEVISGLNYIECTVDDVPYTEYTQEIFGKVLLCNGEEAVSGISFDIPLLDEEIHTVGIIAADNVGNILEQSFRVHASPKDVISVVLPTSFGMTIFPYASNGNIWGEDIVIANQSEFPVEVTLKSTQVNIDHTLPETNIMKSSVPVGNTRENPLDLTDYMETSVKDAKLNLVLNMFGDEKSVLDLQEGYSMPGDCFVLEPKKPDTDAVALQNDPSEKSVTSGDYAIVNIRGTIAEGSETMWKDGDIEVALTFTFRRLEDSADVPETAEEN